MAEEIINNDSSNTNSQPGEQNGGQPGEQNGKALTFDEMLTANKAYQSEFDKRVSKALETAKEKWTATTENATQTAVAKAVAEATDPLNGKIKNLIITAEVIKAAAKDPADIISQLDLTKVTIDGEKIDGLSDQINTIKERKPYLFNVEKPEEKPAGKSGLSHDEGHDDTAEIAKIRRVMGLSNK